MTVESARSQMASSNTASDTVDIVFWVLAFVAAEELTTRLDAQPSKVDVNNEASLIEGMFDDGDFGGATS